jgi:ZIP family zinc transporter
MVSAALWAALGQAALLVGALLCWRFPTLTRPRWLGLIMAFGAGAVISAVTTDLVAEAYRGSGPKATGLGLALGAIGFFLVTGFLERRGESERPEAPLEAAAAVSLDQPEEQTLEQGHGASPTEARNLTIGMVLDGIPESIAIGLTVFSGTVSVSLVAAVFLAGLPEAIGVAAALLAGGIAITKILARFTGIVVVGAVSGLLGYTVLSAAPAASVSVIQGVAAGAMIVVVVNEMIPIAVRGTGRWAGLAAAGGFALSAFLAIH